MFGCFMSYVYSFLNLNYFNNKILSRIVFNKDSSKYCIIPRTDLAIFH